MVVAGTRDDYSSEMYHTARSSVKDSDVMIKHNDNIVDKSRELKEIYSAKKK